MSIQRNSLCPTSLASPVMWRCSQSTVRWLSKSTRCPVSSLRASLIPPNVDRTPVPSDAGYDPTSQKARSQSSSGRKTRIGHTDTHKQKSTTTVVAPPSTHILTQVTTILNCSETVLAPVLLLSTKFPHMLTWTSETSKSNNLTGNTLLTSSWQGVPARWLEVLLSPGPIGTWQH